MNRQRKKTRSQRQATQQQHRRSRQLVGELLEPRYLLATSQVLDITEGPAGSHPHDFVAVGGEVFFMARGAEIWKTDGTIGGTALVTDLTNWNGEYFHWDDCELHNHNGTLVVALYDPEYAA